MRSFSEAKVGAALLIAGVLASGCTGLDTRVESQATDLVDAKLGLDGSRAVDHREGGECIVVEVEAPNSETYRVIFVAQHPPPNPYEPLGVSQIFTLDDFIGDSDVWCGATKTDAYGKDANGNWALLG